MSKSELEKLVIWVCPVCRKYDTSFHSNNNATPEHRPYRGVDLGNCNGEMVKVTIPVSTAVQAEVKKAEWNGRALENAYLHRRRLDKKSNSSRYFIKRASEISDHLDQLKSKEERNNG